MALNKTVIFNNKKINDTLAINQPDCKLRPSIGGKKQSLHCPMAGEEQTLDLPALSFQLSLRNTGRKRETQGDKETWEVKG